MTKEPKFKRGDRVFSVSGDIHSNISQFKVHAYQLDREPTFDENREMFDYGCDWFENEIFKTRYDAEVELIRRLDHLKTIISGKIAEIRLK